MSPPVETQEIANAYRQTADRLIDALTENHDAYERLTELVDLFGHRVSGSVALEQAIEQWGPVALESELFDFDQTDYSRGQMGADLKKVLWAHQQLADPAGLADWKNQAGEWETQCQRVNGGDVARSLNLDPGYLTEAKLVLATTKDSDHRIYLKDGIFAEVTLYYHKQQWQSRPWTYPDFAAADYHPFHTRCRNQLRER